MPSTLTLAQLTHALAQDARSFRGLSLALVDEAHRAALAKEEQALLISAPEQMLVYLGPAHALAALPLAVLVHDVASHHAQALAVLQASLPTPAAAISHHPAQSVLLVEDDPMTRTIVSELLRARVPTFAAEDGRQATANYTVHQPDLVFLDVHYPDTTIDGFDVLTQILSMDQEARIVMFSGDCSPPTVVRALSMGAKGFIAKPFHAEDFVYYLRK